MWQSLLIAVLMLGAARLAAGEQPGTSADRPAGTIAFPSLAPRGWDIYLTDVQTRGTRRLTDHPALDYNAGFSPDGRRIAFVSERDGNMELYVMNRDGSALHRLTADFALDDHPAWSPDGRRLAFMSTRQPAETPGQAWNAVYVMDSDGSNVRRLSGTRAADYSPAWSPRGDLIAVASGSGIAGGTDLVVMRPDGTGRRRVVQDGGWPSFSADGARIYFHRKRPGNWGIWRVNVDGSGVERITPPEVAAYTPQASADGKWLVAAVQHGGHRQIAVIDLATRAMTVVTRDPTDHWNPSIAPDGRQVVYHKVTPGGVPPNVELWATPPGTELTMLRTAGAFPAFSPDGRHVALTGSNFAELDVMAIDGSDRKTIDAAAPRTIFGVSWARHGDRIAFSRGIAFQGPSGGVDVMVIRPDGSAARQLTAHAGNNGFPSFSPDGTQIVFRSGRSRWKNLYLMHRDGTGVRRLTEGRWTDTMADWSPTGGWIAFASDRGGEFAIWLIKPDGTGLHKLVGGGGRNNHPHFSPDGRWVVFASQRAGYSEEEISLPHQFQPYGELFAVRLDGTGLIRLTHNGFEEGTPAWGPLRRIQPSAAGRQGRGDEY